MGRLLHRAAHLVRGAILGAYLITVVLGGGLHIDRTVADSHGATHRVCIFLHAQDHDGLTHDCPDNANAGTSRGEQPRRSGPAVADPAHDRSQWSACHTFCQCTQQPPSTTAVLASAPVPPVRSPWIRSVVPLPDGSLTPLSGRSPPLA